MANAIYPSYKQSILNGDADSALNGSGTTGLYVALVDTGVYTYNSSHQFYSSLSGVIGTDQEITSVTLTEGVVDGNSVVFSGVTGNVGALVFYRRNAGANTTWRLIAYIDTGQFNLPITVNNSTLTVAWGAFGIFSVFEYINKKFIGGTLIVDADTFGTAALTTTRNINAALYVNPDTFPAASVSSSGGGEVTMQQIIDGAGVRSGVTLTNYTGPSEITTAGTLVEAKRITDSIRVLANNVTFRDCEFDYNAVWGIDADGASGLNVQYCTFIGSGGNSCILTGSGSTVIGCDFSVAENGVTFQDGAHTMRLCHIHDLDNPGSSDPHIDGVSIQGGQNGVLLEDNVIFGWDTSCIFIKTDFAAISNITINHNWLMQQPGQGPCTNIYSEETGGRQITNVNISNNFLDNGGPEKFYFSFVGNQPNVCNNFDFDTGNPIPNQGTCP